MARQADKLHSISRCIPSLHFSSILLLISTLRPFVVLLTWQVMCMVGYILGLGDRHPNNLMINRNSGYFLPIIILSPPPFLSFISSLSIAFFLCWEWRNGHSHRFWWLFRSCNDSWKVRREGSFLSLSYSLHPREHSLTFFHLFLKFKVPFRLTRMLSKAMEVAGIDGLFRATCESVMRVLRDNRERSSLFHPYEVCPHLPQYYGCPRSLRARSSH